MNEAFDCIVIGVGGVGSAATYQLARRGVDVLGIEQFDIPHSNGSSQGYSRLIRLTQYENPVYAPLVKRAYQLWHALEERTGRDVLQKTGALDIGMPDGELLGGSVDSCNAHELLSATAVNQRFPAFELPDCYRPVYQPDGGSFDRKVHTGSHRRCT